MIEFLVPDFRSTATQTRIPKIQASQTHEYQSLTKAISKFRVFWEISGRARGKHTLKTVQIGKICQFEWSGRR